MEECHYAQGSEQPAYGLKTLRLYGMKFCPYTERVRLALWLCDAPHEIIYINLKNKPDWYCKLSTEGKVPVLEYGVVIVKDSLGIVRFLGELYEDSMKRLPEDTELMDKFTMVEEVFANAIYNRLNKPLDYYLNQMYNCMDTFEQALTERNTRFFAGNVPGYVDYMIWPWSERSKVPSIINNVPFEFPEERFPKLVIWRKEMKEMPAIKAIAMPAERHAALVKKNIQFELHGTPIDYDNV